MSTPLCAVCGQAADVSDTTHAQVKCSCMGDRIVHRSCMGDRELQGVRMMIAKSGGTIETKAGQLPPKLLKRYVKDVRMLMN